MPSFNIVFHVHDKDRAGAEEWRDRAHKILQAHSDQLISATREVDQTKVGSFCPGHVIEPTEADLGASSRVPTPRA